MNNIDKISTVDEGQPDDLLVTSASFEEERCLEATGRLVDYSAKCTVVLDFESTTNPRGEARKARSAALLMKKLSGFDLGGAPRHLSISGNDPVGLTRELKLELRGRQIELKRLSVTVDISCLTKIQLVAIMKLFSSSEAAKRLRFIYSYPKIYNTSGWDRHARLYSGFSKPVVFPIKGVVVRSSRIEERLAVVLIGHEGERTFAAWRSAEPDCTWILEGRSENLDVMEACRLENLYLYDYVEQNRNANRKYSFESLDYNTARSALSAALESLNPQTTQIAVIPFGPKPLLVALVAAIFDTEDMIAQLVYPPTSSYNSQYSSGVASVCVYEIR